MTRRCLRRGPGGLSVAMNMEANQAPGSVVHSEPNPAPNRFRTPDRGTEPNPDTARREPNRTRTPRGGTEPNPDTARRNRTEPGHRNRNRTEPNVPIASNTEYRLARRKGCWKLLEAADFRSADVICNTCMFASCSSFIRATGKEQTHANWKDRRCKEGLR